MLFNTSIQPNLNPSYEEVLDWLDNNLEIEIQGSSGGLEVRFTKFPPVILSYISQNNNKRSLKQQIVIFICKTHDNGKNKYFGKRNYRTYTIPTPQSRDPETDEIHFAKNWRILPYDCAKNGKYVFHKFFNLDNKYRTGIYARDLGGLTIHDTYMVAIALANNGRLTDHIWLSNIFNYEAKQKHNT